MFLLIDIAQVRPTSTQSISIHLMFLLITYQTPPSKIAVDFNTSHVSINPTDRRDAAPGPKFQYISCFY